MTLHLFRRRHEQVSFPHKTGDGTQLTIVRAALLQQKLQLHRLVFGGHGAYEECVIVVGEMLAELCKKSALPGASTAYNEIKIVRLHQRPVVGGFNERLASIALSASARPAPRMFPTAMRFAIMDSGWCHG